MRYMKRQSFAIASEMLYSAIGGVRKTHFVHSCNLSTKLCEKYIQLLLKKRFLEKKEDQFKTTEKGIQFLKTYKRVEHLWSVKNRR